MQRTSLQLICIILLFQFIGCPWAWGQAWEKLADFPDKRDDAVGFALAAQGYIGTGRDEGFGYRSDFWKYDPVLDRWTEAAALPGTPRQYCASFVIGDTAYVFGGVINDSGECLGELWAYYGPADTWSRKADLPASARQSSIAFAYGNRGYIASGRNRKEVFNDMWQYDPAADQWQRLSDLPFKGRYEAASFNIGDWLYIAGGRDTSVSFSEVWRYDVQEQQWLRCRDLPVDGLVYSIGFTAGNRGFLLTGQDAKGNFLNTVFQYNPFSDAWHIADTLPADRRRGTAGFVLGNRICLVGGLTQQIQRTAEVWSLSAGLLPPQVVYPNPARQKLVIEGTHPVDLVLFDELGRQVLQFSSNEREVVVGLERLTPGIYHYHLAGQEGTLIVLPPE